MLKRFIATAGALVAGSVASAAPVTTVDLVDPTDNIGQPPAGVAIVDVLVSVAAADGLWTAGGMRATAQNGATFKYRPNDNGTPDLDSPMLGGLAATRTIFATSISDPRSRGAGDTSLKPLASRKAKAASPVATSAPTPAVEATATLFNCAWFRAPDAQPPYSGATARVAVNLPAGVTAANLRLTSGTATPPASHPLVLVASQGLNQDIGTVSASVNFPGVTGLNWVLSTVPEPASLSLLVLGALAAFRRR